MLRMRSCPPKSHAENLTLLWVIFSTLLPIVGLVSIILPSALLKKAFNTSDTEGLFYQHLLTQQSKFENPDLFWRVYPILMIIVNPYVILLLFLYYLYILYYSCNESFKISHYLTYCWTFVYLWRWLLRLLGLFRFGWLVLWGGECIGVYGRVDRVGVLGLVCSHHVVVWTELFWLVDLLVVYLWWLVVLWTVV